MRALEDRPGSDCEVFSAFVAAVIAALARGYAILLSATDRAFNSIRPKARLKINPRRRFVGEHFEKLKSADRDVIVHLQILLLVKTLRNAPLSCQSRRTRGIGPPNIGSRLNDSLRTRCDAVYTSVLPIFFRQLICGVLGNGKKMKHSLGGFPSWYGYPTKLARFLIVEPDSAAIQATGTTDRFFALGVFMFTIHNNLHSFDDLEYSNPAIICQGSQVHIFTIFAYGANR